MGARDQFGVAGIARWVGASDLANVLGGWAIRVPHEPRAVYMLHLGRVPLALTFPATCHEIVVGRADLERMYVREFISGLTDETALALLSRLAHLAVNGELCVELDDDPDGERQAAWIARLRIEIRAVPPERRVQ